MHPLIKRAIAFRTEFMNTHQGQPPDGPFIIYQSEWLNFINSDDAAIHLPSVDLSDPSNFSIGGMSIKVLEDMEPIE